MGSIDGGVKKKHSSAGRKFFLLPANVCFQHSVIELGLFCPMISLHAQTNQPKEPLYRKRATTPRFRMHGILHP
jgi:hypothetical protein